MGLPLPKYEPIIYVTVYLTGVTYRFATDDYYDGSGNYFKGTLLSDLKLTRQLSDLYYGVEDSKSITLSFSNGPSKIDPTWDQIVETNNKELRGRSVLVERYDPTDGTSFEIRGVITKYKLGSTVDITIEMRDDVILEMLLPKEVVTTDAFTATALNVGEAVNLCFGYCRNVPLRNVQNKISATSTATGTNANQLIDNTANFSDEENEYVYNITDRTLAKITNVVDIHTLTLDTDIMVSGEDYTIHAHDYLIGSGVIESLWVDHANGYGVRRDGVLVDTTEYDFYDGSQGSPYSGYAFIRFGLEQMDFSPGKFYTISSDIKGLELGGATAERNFATILKHFLSNATWGLGDSIDAASFATAASDLDTIGDMYCDGSVTEQRKAKDIVDEILEPARARIWRAADGEWEIAVDKTGSSSVLSLGCNDGFYNNCEVVSASAASAKNTLQAAIVQYSLDPANKEVPFKELNVAVHAGFGEIKTYELPFVLEDDTAIKVLSYLKNRSLYSDKIATIRGGMECRDLNEGDIITLTDPLRDISAREYMIQSISKSIAGFDLECREYSTSIYDTEAIAPPLAQQSTGITVRGAATMVGTIVLGDGLNQPGTITLNVAPGLGDVYIAAGKRDFTNVQTGFILGIDDSVAGDPAKFYLGSPSKYLTWDGVNFVLEAGNFSIDVSGNIIATGGNIGGWIISATALADNAVVADANIYIDSANTLIRCGPTTGVYLTVDGANLRIRSSNYVSGMAGAGFTLEPDLLEVGNIAARGIMRTAVFQKDVISCIGGNLAVLPADVLETTMTDLDAAHVVIEGNETFVVGDFLRIKTGDDLAGDGSNDDEWFEIIGAAGADYTVTRDMDADYGVDGNPTWPKGATVVNYGQSGDGLVYMTASDDNAPYLTVMTHAGAPWNALSEKVRIGNLNGFNGLYGVDIYGLAIYEDANNYLLFDPTNGIRIASSTSEAITIKGGGGINIDAGGDIILEPSDDNPALIKWSTVHNLGAASNVLRGLCIWPTTANQDRMMIGYDPVNNIPKEYKYFRVYTNEFIFLSAKVDADNNSYVNIISDIAPSNDHRIVLYTEEGTVIRMLTLQNGNSAFWPSPTENINLGLNTHKWKDAYFAGDIYLANSKSIGIGPAVERLEFYEAGYAAFRDCNVMIGEGIPTRDFVLNSADRPFFAISRAGVEKLGIGISDTGGVEGTLIQGDAAGDAGIRSVQDLFFSANSGTTAHMVLKNNGNVLLSFITGSAKLCVNGGVNIGGNGAVADNQLAVAGLAGGGDKAVRVGNDGVLYAA